MISATGSVLFYALVAAASPLVFAATLVVIRSARQRVNSLAFLIGFVLGTTIAAVLGLVLGQATGERLGSHEVVTGLLALLLGVALIGAGLDMRRRSTRLDAATDQESAVAARLGHVDPAAALSLAGLLGFGGPKRLILTFLAMATVSNADLGSLEDLTLLAVYVAVSTLLVSVPVGIVVIGGRRASVVIDLTESWLKQHAEFFRVWIALVLGVTLVVDGIVRLT